MARLINNPFGDISGKVGSLVFKKSKKGTYISSLPISTNKKATSVPQQLQRNKLKLVMQFLRPLQPVLRKSYLSTRKDSPSFHTIKSYYLKNAIRYMEDQYVIDYSKAVVSLGNIRPPEQAHIERVSPLQFQLEWKPQCSQAMTRPNDEVMLVLYHPDTHHFVHTGKLALREEGSASFTLHPSRADLIYHAWLGYILPENKGASVSVYLGEV